MSTTWEQKNPSLGPKWRFGSSLTTAVAWQLKVFARCKAADDLPGAAKSLDEIERELKIARHWLAVAESVTADGGAK